MNGNGQRGSLDALLNAGDFIGSAWVGPRWTPYAERIASHYKNIVPWFLTVSSGLGTPPDRNTATTRPYQHDVLIMGCSAHVAGAAPDNGNFIYLQITHQETGLSWAAPNVMNSAPLPAYAGINNSGMPIVALPDAFFLPKHTTLRLDWAAIAGPTNPPITINTNARITFVGVQLIGPFNGQAPKQVAMPDGKTINVGDRLPWFGTIGLGTPNGVSALQGRGFVLTTRQQRTQYIGPVDCDVELHDAYANFLAGGTADSTNLFLKLVDRGTATYWNPSQSPVTSIFGSELQVNPAMPLSIPYLLRKDHRMQIVALNNVAGAGTSDIFNGLVTFRGVRLCEF